MIPSATVSFERRRDTLIAVTSLNTVSSVMNLTLPRPISTWTGSSPRRPLFYTPSHLSRPQDFKSIISTDFCFIFIFKMCTTQFSQSIVSCTKNI